MGCFCCSVPLWHVGLMMWCGRFYHLLNPCWYAVMSAAEDEWLSANFIYRSRITTKMWFSVFTFLFYFFTFFFSFLCVFLSHTLVLFPASFQGIYLFVCFFYSNAPLIFSLSPTVISNHIFKTMIDWSASVGQLVI